LKRNDSLIINLIVGLVGSLIGAFVARALGINFGGWIGSLLVSTAGAVLLLVVYGMIRKRRV
jgi:uncharacterized membrane protein YeaQ/YmgE (transglycosylase-associated protein family)